MSEPTAGKGTLLEHMIRSKVPIGELLGFSVSQAGDGGAVVTLQTGPQHFNPMGTLHGGVLCDIADTAMGFAFASTLAAGESFTTIELKINYLRPVREAQLRATGRIVHRGRTVGYAECDVTDQNGKLVAKSSSTCIVLRGEQAAGR
jgi:uncharacterized protein (TIGR00369 family)